VKWPWQIDILLTLSVWKKSHLDIIIKQDLIDLENVQQITQIET